MSSHACIDPKHHVHDASAFVAAVERVSHERGLRLTPIRARVLGLIAEIMVRTYFESQDKTAYVVAGTAGFEED